MKPCIDCRLRTERIGWNERMRTHLERLNAACSCSAPRLAWPRFARYAKQYMRLGAAPVPSALLALEPNLRPFVVH